MMFSYIALVWNSASPSQCDAAQALARRFMSVSPEWQTTAKCNGLHVLCTDVRRGSGECHALDAQAGVVLGALFRRAQDIQRGDETRKAVFGPAETAKVLTSKGRELITAYWGQYVAFIVDGSSGRKWVVRDPIGGLPCFGTTFQGVTILFSRMEDCLRLTQRRFSVDWDFIRTRVAAGPIRSQHSALREVFKINSGECVEFSDERISRRFYWDPREIGRLEPVEDVREAAALLRATTHDCVHAWASCYDGIVHKLSGGFDSSVVLACLKDAPTRPRITSQTYYMPRDSVGDERPYARAAAASASCELAEWDRTAFSLQFEELMHAPPCPIPAAQLAYLETGGPAQQLAHERQAGAVFTGLGGDALFGRGVYSLAVVDYAQRHGIRADLFKLASRMTFYTDLSIWALVSKAVRDGILTRNLDPGEGALNPRDLVSDAARDTVTGRLEILHAWFQPTQGVPPGKLLHLRLMLGAEPWFHDPLAPADSPEEVQPLQSQPLVELSLRIPTYIHVWNGQQRGLARQAFAADLPAEILTRTWKGSPGNLAEQHIMRSIKFIRELLLDGYLVKEQLLDRGKVERALTGPTRLSGRSPEIFDYVITEAWVKGWMESEQYAAAA